MKTRRIRIGSLSSEQCGLAILRDHQSAHRPILNGSISGRVKTLKATFYGSWTGMRRGYLRYLWLDQSLVPAAVNFLIVGGIAWGMFGTQSEIPMYGTTSVAAELLATGFLLPLITCLLNGPLVRRQVQSGKLPPLPTEQRPKSGIYRKRSVVRGVILGGPGLLFAGMTILALHWLGASDAMDAKTFIIAKAVWAAIFGLWITPTPAEIPRTATPSHPC